MKKRMIAWLLCACMTFTAAPEMLLIGCGRECTADTGRKQF